MKFIKRTVLILFLFVISTLGFIFWGSTHQLTESEYTAIVHYNHTPPATDSTFTIITYNIGYLSGMMNNTSQVRKKADFERHMTQVKLAFDMHDPDFIGLQEVDFNSSRSFHVNQLDELANKLGIVSAAKAINWDKRYVPFPYFPPTQHFGSMQSGQAILSKYPIRLHDRIVLNRPPNDFWFDAFYLERLAQVATIQVNGQDIVIINVHLEAYHKETRLQQSEAVLALYRNYAKAYPTLLIGDFNSEPPHNGDDAPSLNVFLNEPQLKSACPASEYRKAKNMTYPSESPNQQIDFIFYHEDQIEVIDQKVIHEIGTASDHLPVLMKFKLKGQ